MHLTADYVHPYRGGAGAQSGCRIRLYLPEEGRDAPVVICSELASNPGTSVTNAAEQIAAEIISNFRLPKPPVWIEHYPPEARRVGEGEGFDLVIFSTYEVRETMRGGLPYLEIGQPTWKRLDRKTVEVLVGQTIS